MSERSPIDATDGEEPRPVAREPRSAPPGAGVRRPGSKPPRSRAREFALQALYQHLVGRNEPTAIDAFTRDLIGFHKADALHFDALLHGCIAQGGELDALLEPLLDRKIAELSPIEHAVLWIGAYEMRHCVDVPWRVVLNECIELAKEFGGTDGHKYVNGVLNRLAPQLRPAEVERDRSHAPRRQPSSPPKQPRGSAPK